LCDPELAPADYYVLRYREGKYCHRCHERLENIHHDWRVLQKQWRAAKILPDRSIRQLDIYRTHAFNKGIIRAAKKGPGHKDYKDYRDWNFPAIERAELWIERLDWASRNYEGHLQSLKESGHLDDVALHQVARQKKEGEERHGHRMDLYIGFLNDQIRELYKKAGGELLDKEGKPIIFVNEADGYPDVEDEKEYLLDEDPNPEEDDEVYEDLEDMEDGPNNLPPYFEIRDYQKEMAEGKVPGVKKDDPNDPFVE
jgi:hypothetical protein